MKVSSEIFPWNDEEKMTKKKKLKPKKRSQRKHATNIYTQSNDKENKVKNKKRKYVKDIVKRNWECDNELSKQEDNLETDSEVADSSGEPDDGTIKGDLFEGSKSPSLLKMVCDHRSN